MKKIVSYIIVLIFVFASNAYAYNLTLDVKANNIELRPPVKMAPGAVAQQDINIQIKTKSMGNQSWSLYILATESMLGPQLIPAEAVTWRGLTTPFIDGKLVKGVPQLIATGVGNTNINGRLRFEFTPGSYIGGQYDMPVQFILSSP